VKKPPRHNAEAELGIIGTLISEGSYESHLVQKALLVLDEKYFYRPLHKELFNIIKSCYEKKHPFDVVALIDTKPCAEIGQIITYLATLYFSHTRFEAEIKTIQKAWQIRQQTRALENTLKQVEGSPLVSDALNALHEGIQQVGAVSIDRVEQGSTYTEIANAHARGCFKGDEPIETGVEAFGKWCNSSMITIAGAPGVGKTYFGIYVMDAIARFKDEHQNLFFSLEMPRNKIWERHQNILQSQTRTVNSDNFTVYDHPMIDIEYIETISRLQALQQPVAVIVVDYLSLVTSKKRHDRDDLRVSDITQRLAALAMELGCVVICLSQVNRSPSQRDKDDRCPYPHDAADSSGSVRSSSLWVGIDRPELYDEDAANKNVFVAKCRKNRNGDNFEAYFNFNGGQFAPRDKPFWPVTAKKNFKQQLTDRMRIDDLGGL